MGSAARPATAPSLGTIRWHLAQTADSMHWAAGDLVMGGTAAIWSFKEVQLGIGELDFQADDGFLEAILSFVISLPTADIWQARAAQACSANCHACVLHRLAV